MMSGINNIFFLLHTLMFDFFVFYCDSNNSNMREETKKEAILFDENRKTRQTEKQIEEAANCFTH